MNDRSAVEIQSLPLTTKERQHKSRKRHGYHVYLSFFFLDFKQLEYEQKKQRMEESHIWSRLDTNYSSDEDSVMTPKQPQPHEIMRLASRHWNRVDASIQGAWRSRASMLNARPPNDGSFEAIPAAIAIPSIEENVRVSLTLEWQRFAADLKRAIRLNSMRQYKYSANIYRFGDEIVVLQSQIYRSFFMSHLLKLTIFGSPLYSALSNHKIAHRGRWKSYFTSFPSGG